MATSPSPSSSKPISSISTTTVISPSKKPIQSLPWTHQETMHLIQSYQEKWYSLKKGQLKSTQWEEVAVQVAARCGYDYSEPSKTSTQCRHKMEKLRQRYRAEKQRLSLGGACYWQYFDLMDRLERGPLPISARPISLIPYSEEADQFTDKMNDNDDIDVDEVDEDEKSYSKSRSIEYILKRPTVVNRFSGERSSGNGGKGGNGLSGKRREMVEEREEEVEEGERGTDEMVSKLAAEIREFAERFIGVESMKLEMMRETERCRMEIENRRIEMILESQQKIVDSIARAFGSPKRVKIDQGI